MDQKSLMDQKRIEYLTFLLENMPRCPFCGAVRLKLVEKSSDDMSPIPYAYVECEMCHARGPIKNDWGNNLDYKMHAVQAWIRRDRG